MKEKVLANKGKIIVVAAIVVVVLLVIINGSKGDEGIYTDEVVKVQDIETFFAFSGNIDSNDRQNVQSKTNLSVKKFYVEEGDFVNEGDLLFELDDQSIASNLEQAKANVELAKINLDAARGGNRDQQLAQAKLSLNTSQINYDAAAGTSKEQQMVQIINALKNAQLAYDDALLNYERIEGLHQMGGAAEVELDQARSGLNQANTQLEIAQSNYDNMEATINQSIDLAKEQLDAAQSTYKATESSLNNNILSAEEQLKQAQASYDLIQQQYDDTRVVAEISGEVSEIHVSENESIAMGMPIMNIVDYDDLIVEVKVDEYDLKAISLGKEVDVVINSLDEKVKGTVTAISREAEVVNDVSFFETTVTLEANENLRIGLSAEVTIPNESVKDATTISMKAIQFDNENKPFIYYRDDADSLVTKEISIGINDGVVVEILEGVEPGETILVPITYPNYMTVGPH